MLYMDYNVPKEKCLQIQREDTMPFMIRCGSRIQL
jgi:hypothetical protein